MGSHSGTRFVQKIKKMQKSKIFFQIFIWTFLVNIREAKPTSQNSERMQRRAITGQIPDLYGPIADIPPTFSSAIEMINWPEYGDQLDSWYEDDPYDMYMSQFLPSSTNNIRHL